MFYRNSNVLNSYSSTTHRSTYDSLSISPTPSVLLLSFHYHTHLHLPVIPSHLLWPIYRRYHSFPAMLQPGPKAFCLCSSSRAEMLLPTTWTRPHFDASSEIHQPDASSRPEILALGKKEMHEVPGHVSCRSSPLCTLVQQKGGVCWYM